MEEDIKEIECFFNKNFFVNSNWASVHRNEMANLEESIENLIKGYRELEEWKREEGCSIQEVYELFIPKSKIKEKIEEYKKTLNKGENKYILSGYYETKIQVLQQLMEDK